MKKLIILILCVFAFTFVKAQNYVNITQPYNFLSLKGIKVNGLILIGTHDSAARKHYVDSLLNLQVQPHSYEIEVSVPGTTTYTIPFILKTTSQIYCNGWLLKNSLWSGNGTTSITLAIDAKQNDLIKIQN